MTHLKYLPEIWLLFMGSCIGLPAQDIEFSKTRKIEIQTTDSLVITGICVQNTNFTPKNALYYYWFDKGRIYKNLGGYDGNLLDGDYKVFDMEGRLVSAGEYQKGLMSGEWKYWYPNGNLMSRNHWKKGERNGRQEYFSPDGQILRVAYYKEGILHGKTIDYDGGKETVMYFRKGKEILRGKPGNTEGL